MRKPTFCICENKDADQLRGNREANQCLCFRYLDSMIPLLSKYEISSLWPSSVAVQPVLCRTRSETRMLVFSRRGSYVVPGCGWAGRFESGFDSCLFGNPESRLSRDKVQLICVSTVFTTTNFLDDFIAFS